MFLPLPRRRIFPIRRQVAIRMRASRTFDGAFPRFGTVGTVRIVTTPRPLEEFQVSPNSDSRQELLVPILQYNDKSKLMITG
jgi:hypothetical protein